MPFLFIHSTVGRNVCLNVKCLTWLRIKCMNTIFPQLMARASLRGIQQQKWNKFEMSESQQNRAARWMRPKLIDH